MINSFAEWWDGVEWIVYGPLNRTYADVADITPRELLNMWHGYIWRRQQNENMLASLVTTWIANYAGKSSKGKVTVKDIFSDGRFNKTTELTDDDREIIEELYRR